MMNRYILLFYVRLESHFAHKLLHNTIEFSDYELPKALEEPLYSYFTLNSNNIKMVMAL